MKGVTFSGGEPFCQAQEFYELAKKIKSHGLNIITYTGFTFENLLEMSKIDTACMRLLENSDFLVDGPFVESKKDLSLKFKGSSNQRIIDVGQSIKNGYAIECDFNNHLVKDNSNK